MIMAGEFTNHGGFFDVTLSDTGVTAGDYIIADAVLVKPLSDPNLGTYAAVPGSWANREENGFIGGVMIQMDDPLGPEQTVSVRIDGPLSWVDGDNLKLMFEGDGQVLEIYEWINDQKGARIYSGDTWEIDETTFESFEIRVVGLREGETELLLSIEGEIFDRPIADLMVINVIGA